MSLICDIAPREADYPLLSVNQASAFFTAIMASCRRVSLTPGFTSTAVQLGVR
jgi:hypothetical protein